jgi:hypothetical protein
LSQPAEERNATKRGRGTVTSAGAPGNCSDPKKGGPGWSAEKWTSANALSALAYLLITPFIVRQAFQRRRLFLNNRHVLNNMHVSRGVLRVTAMYSLLVMSFLLRAMWLLLEEANVCTNQERGPDTRALVCPCFMVLRVANRFGTLFSFSAFSVVAIFWSEVLSLARAGTASHQREEEEEDGNGGKDADMQSEASYGGSGGTDSDSETSAGAGMGGDDGGLLGGGRAQGGGGASGDGGARNCCSPQTLFTMINVWVYIIETVVLCFTAFGHWPDETYDLIKKVNYVVVASFFLLLTLAMLCVGRSVRNLSKSAGARLSNKMSIVMLTCALCFTMRSVFFVWEPISGHKIDPDIFHVLKPTFLYPVPDILPAIVLLFAMAPGPVEASDEMDGAPSEYVPGDGSWMRQALLRPEVELEVALAGSINDDGGSGGDGQNAPQSREWF